MKKSAYMYGFASLLVTVIMIASDPTPARAQLHTIDLPNLAQNTITAAASNLLGNSYNLKEFGLDPIAWAVSKAAIASMTKSMVNWINSGFNGSPAFVGNLQVYLGNLSFATENTFINQLSSNAALNSPFQSQVAALLNVNYLKSSANNGFFLQNPYTLNQVSSNPTGFVKGTTDFTAGGGWNAWFSLTTQPQNNTYGSYFISQAELNNRLSTVKSNASQQLAWGQGFLSWCGTTVVAPTIAPVSQGVTAATPIFAADGTVTYSAPTTATFQTATPAAVNASAPNNAQLCTNSDGSTGTIQTPGSVIQAQINKTLGLSGDQLVTADEFNEVIGALVGQLVNQVVGSTGLSGISSVSSGGNGYVDQAAAQAASLTSSSAQSASAPLSNAISGELQQVTLYQSAWQTIGNEAGFANSALASCVNAPAGAAAQVASTVAAASAAAAKANTAINALNTVQNQATAAGTNAASIATAGNNYQNLTVSNTIPSASDIAYAQTQAQDDTTATSTTSTTLYGQMKVIVQQCSQP